jgi:hypothetical protein
MPERRASLVVDLPVLDAVLDGELACPPELYRLASRGTVEPLGGDARLAEALGLNALPAAGPRAALAAGDAIDAGSTWLRADPVALTPDLTAVWLRGPVALDWDAPAMESVQDALAESFEHAGLDWHRPATGQPGRIRFEAPTGIHFTPLNEARGRRLDEILPSGEDVRRWHGLINELQMVFHQFRSLNATHSGGYGFWFWGEGALPADPPGEVKVAAALRVAGAGGDEGVARWLGLTRCEVNGPVEFGPGTTLVDADPGADGGAVLARLDADVLGPAWQALQGGRLRAITVVGLHRSLVLGRTARLAFWRRAPQGLLR